MRSNTWNRLQIMTWTWNPTEQTLQTFRLVFAAVGVKSPMASSTLNCTANNSTETPFYHKTYSSSLPVTLLHCWKSQPAPTLFAAPGHTRLLSVVKSLHKNHQSITQSISQVVKSLFKSIFICVAPVYNKGYLTTLSNLIWSRQYWCFSSSFWVLFHVFGLNEHSTSLPELVTRCVETMSVSHLLWGHRRLGFKSYLPTIRQFVYVVFFFSNASIRNKHPNAHNALEPWPLQLADMSLQFMHTQHSLQQLHS